MEGGGVGGFGGRAIGSGWSVCLRNSKGGIKFLQILEKYYKSLLYGSTKKSFLLSNYNSMCVRGIPPLLA